MDVRTGKVQKVSLWGGNSRRGLWIFVALSAALAIGSVVYGFWDRRFFQGAYLLFGAFMYWLSIWWIDRYGSWEADE